MNRSLRRFILTWVIRVTLFAFGGAFFGVAGYFALGFVLYVPSLADAYKTSDGFRISVYAIALGGALATVIWFGNLAEGAQEEAEDEAVD